MKPANINLKPHTNAIAAKLFRLRALAYGVQAALKYGLKINITRSRAEGLIFKCKYFLLTVQPEQGFYEEI